MVTALSQGSVRLASTKRLPNRSTTPAIRPRPGLPRPVRVVGTVLGGSAIGAESSGCAVPMFIHASCSGSLAVARSTNPPARCHSAPRTSTRPGKRLVCLTSSTRYPEERSHHLYYVLPEGPSPRLRSGAPAPPTPGGASPPRPPPARGA